MTESSTAPVPLPTRAAAYHRPARLEQALELLAAGPRTVLAGGTDLYPAAAGRPVRLEFLDVTAIEELRGIRVDGDAVTVGATTTWTELARAPLPPAFRALQAAARQVGAVQIQNAGTVAGNVCNASPAADGVPPMLVLDAEVVLRSARGERVLPLAGFLLGNRRTARQADELVTALRFPALPARTRSAFLKLGHRSSLVISIVMVAAAVETGGDGAVRRAAVAVGACSPVALRLPALERKLVGRRAGPDLAALAAPEDLAALTPIDDLRGTAAYRREAALVLVRRCLTEVLS